MKKAGAISFSLLLTVGMGIFFVYIFLLSTNNTEEYKCVMSHVESSSVVRRHLGTPVEPGRFTFLSYQESQGSRLEMAFSTSVTGPNGRGRVQAEIFRSLATSAMQIDLRVDGETLTIYSGKYQCQPGIGR
jgi:hypothetical protein